ncbi:oxysterol-binding protein-related protein 6 isoform X1 [Carassius auratus]|uniref:Oxysterol-binding protein n=1 Tax=Carassius auratus TaxID=7957 RepID=A0A6P6N1Q7_CARAU|nr:oxysterol-binding protein-related protein 6-like isoform X1 [Carassius auratus]XP_026102937.1 oxysterol-binding protein-related protein 6-like isoform X1 [Carassius auratus]XP_026102938.1 oxysterol-binding protein-related protein 6-like isoform X1 [Carassius auratus]
MDYHGSSVDQVQSQTSGAEKVSSSWHKPTHSRSSSTASSRHSRLNIKDWEVMDVFPADLNLTAENMQDVNTPGICEGYLMKRRKRPLKGWHKRYFVLDNGILRYSKNQHDFSKGKMHGALDVSLAVMSVNKKARRIDLDAGDILYHMKAKTPDLYYKWVTKLSAHRMYKKNKAANVHNGFLQALSHASHLSPKNSPMQDMGTSYVSEPLPCVNPAINGKVSAWLQTQEPDICAQELTRCQMELTELQQLVQKLHSLESGQMVNNGDLQRIISMQNLLLDKPKKKTGKIWGHSRTLSRVEALGMPFRGITKSLSSSHLNSSSHLGTSVSSIPDYVSTQATPSTPTSSENKKLHQDICSMSLKVHASLRTAHETLAQERQRLQEAWSSRELQQTTSAQINNLCSLAELDVKSRHTKIHNLSVSSISSEESFHTVLQRKSGSGRSFSFRAPSVADSAAEYFDACDELMCASSSEMSDESGLSDGSSNSEPDEAYAMASRKYRASLSKAPPKLNTIKNTGRRTTLPAVCPDNSHVGLMTILYNNIGKDLSRVSMPAALNEPVCLLQRLCEELEYSDLLDTANHTDDPYQRMVYIAAFAISGYATAQYRNRYKPFNPVLGETFECIREDRGFRYISEQVSHHPPISACHAESDNFNFWQDQRWKNKFWGKSLEIMPTGMVNVTLKKYGDHYEWNKVVTCIHNVLSQQRYLEHYGEVIIRNLKSSVCTCKITFVKSRYWGSDGSKNEVQGQVLDETGNVVHRFGGFWHEGIFCDTLPNPQCIWKPNPQPKNYMLYYGFSSFAIEMNELTPDLKPLLPLTDTRLRPDQRLLEEGKIEETDKKKDEVEENQRERRKILAKRGEEHIPRFFRKTLDAAGREVWLYNGTYWKIRENPGFVNVKNLELW